MSVINDKKELYIGSIFNAGLFENKLLAVSLYNFNNFIKTEDGNYIHSLSVSELLNYFSNGNGSVYSQLHDGLYKLSQHKFLMYEPQSNIYHVYHPINEVSYKDGHIKIVYNKCINNLMPIINKYFSDIMFHTLMSFQNLYSLPLYEIIINEMKYGSLSFNISLNKLKYLLGIIDSDLPVVNSSLFDTSYSTFNESFSINKNKFTVWQDFKINVLIPAINEINLKTHYEVQYKPIRIGKGGKVEKISFYVNYKNNNDINEKHLKNLIINEIKQIVDSDYDISTVKEAIKKFDNYDKRIDNK